MNVHVVVAAEGDGWLSVDTDEWIDEKLGERDEELTLDLEICADQNCVSPHRCTAPTDWARQRFDHVTGPSRDDDNPVTFNSANNDNLLTEDICVTLMNARDGHEDMTLAVVRHSDVYVLDPMQEWVDIIDWSRAYGGCANGHTFILEAASYLHADQSQQTHRLTELCRLPDNDVPYEGGYAACPECELPIEFHA